MSKEKLENIKKKIASSQGSYHLGELFKDVAEIKTVEGRADALKTFADKSQGNLTALTIFAQIMWHPKGEMDLPEGEPPLRASDYKDYGFAPSTLQRELGKVGYYMPASPAFLKNMMKREQIFIQSLESLHKPERDLLVMAKDRKMSKEYNGISREVFKTAFGTKMPWLEEELGN